MSSSAIFAQTIPPLSLSVAQCIDVHCVGWRLWLGIAAAETMARHANTRKTMTSLVNNDDLTTIDLRVYIYWHVSGQIYYSPFFSSSFAKRDQGQHTFRKWQGNRKEWQKNHKAEFHTCLRRCVYM